MEMKLQQVSVHCFAVLNEKNRVCEMWSVRIVKFRNEPPDAPWDSPVTFNAICKLAKAKEIEVEF